jgi:hypothetical protein
MKSSIRLPVAARFRSSTPALFLCFILALSGCSGDGGSSPSAPEPAGFLTIGAPIVSHDRVGILEVTVSMDGREIGKYVSPFPSGAVPTIVNVGSSARRGRHSLSFRFDDLTARTSRLSIAASGVYQPGDGSPAEQVQVGSRTQVVSEGQEIAFDFSL